MAYAWDDDLGELPEITVGERVSELQAELDSLRKHHIGTMEEILGRFNRVRGAALHLLSFKLADDYFNDNDECRDAIERLKMAVG